MFFFECLRFFCQAPHVLEPGFSPLHLLCLASPPIALSCYLCRQPSYNLAQPRPYLVPGLRSPNPRCRQDSTLLLLICSQPMLLLPPPKPRCFPSWKTRVEKGLRSVLHQPRRTAGRALRGLVGGDRKGWHGLRRRYTARRRHALRAPFGWVHFDARGLRRQAHGKRKAQQCVTHQGEDNYQRWLELLYV